FGLRNVNLQNAVTVGRRDFGVIRPVRQTDGSGERAITPLEAVVALVLFLDLALATPRHGESVVVGLDRNLVLTHSRQVECINELRLRLPELQSAGRTLRCPRTGLK